MTRVTDATAIRRARPGDLDAVAATLASAFHDDPIFTWCIPDDIRRRGILPGFFGLVGRAIAGYDIHLTGGGAAMWVPPGAPVIPADAGEEFEGGLAELLGADAERTIELVAALDQVHPRTDHHYLWFLGVAPAEQGTGIGSRMLRHMLTAADRSGTPAYLEATSRDNVRLYERHGFTVVDELRTADSPPLWAMWRPARSPILKPGATAGQNGGGSSAGGRADPEAAPTGLVGSRGTRGGGSQSWVSGRP